MDDGLADPIKGVSSAHLREARQRLGLSISAFAALADTSPAVVSAWESGGKAVPLEITSLLYNELIKLDRLAT